MKKQVEDLTDTGGTMVSKATDSLRDKTADVLGRVEEAVRRDEEAKERPKTAEKKEPNK